MILSQLEKNLLVFLDPAYRRKDDEWLFVKPDRSVTPADLHKNQIFCFPRQNLCSYLFCSLKAGFGIRQKGKKIRRVLYLNDGLLCSVFDTANTADYRAFSRNHLPRPKGLRRQLANLLPPFWRAEQRFVVIENNPDQDITNQDDELASTDYLFFSNPAGKLMLTKAAVFRSGTGRLFKTTSVPEYAASLQHEQSIISSLSQRLPKNRLLQGPEDLQVRQGRFCFSEKYLYGENLREVLRNWGNSDAIPRVCQMIDRLDAWFSAYRSAFSGNKTGLSALYAQKLQIFSDLNSGDTACMSLLQHIRGLLAQLDRRHGGVIPGMAHNDLWPGNFIVQGEHLAVIDWERATEHSSPFFDYFWMIISATLEYLVGRNGVQDYSAAFGQFLTQKDKVCCYAFHKLETFLDQLEFNKGMIHQFLLLFLMEWSIQGFLALGRVTDMDQLARGQLSEFFRQTTDGCT